MVAFITPAVPLLLLLGCGCLEVWKRGSGQSETSTAMADATWKTNENHMMSGMIRCISAAGSFFTHDLRNSCTVFATELSTCLNFWIPLNPVYNIYVVFPP